MDANTGRPALFRLSKNTVADADDDSELTAVITNNDLNKPILNQPGLKNLTPGDTRGAIENSNSSCRGKIAWTDEHREQPTERTRDV
jgi:hypothetical protein